MHPGGRRIIEVMAEQLGLAAGDLAPTEAVLSEHGNMSSVTVLFVLDEIMRDLAPAPRRARACWAPSAPASAPSWRCSSSPDRPLAARRRRRSSSTTAWRDAEALRSLGDLRLVDRWLGNRRALAAAVRPYLAGPSPRILDAGCGSGDVLANLRRASGGPALLAVGLDLKPLHLAVAPPGIHRVAGDVRALPFAPRSFDVVTASLFLHHFDAAELPAVLAGLWAVARRALVVNDLRRARVPYVFGRVFFRALFRSPVSVADGLTSIRRAFTDAELRGGLRRRRHPGCADPADVALPSGRGGGARGRMMPYDHDVIVVGGGPAGAATATFLRRRGHDVLLLDEARFPRDKVCGEGVSPEAWRLLAEMGAADAVRALRPQPLLGMTLTAPDGTAFSGFYRGAAGPGFAARRQALDACLLDGGARGGGGGPRRRGRLGRAGRGRACHGRGRGGPARRRRAAGAARGRRGRSAQRRGPSAGPAPGAPRLRKFAVRGYWSGMDGLGEMGEMHVVAGAYCGVAPLGGKGANVTFVVGRDDMSAAGGDLEGFYRRTLGRWPRAGRAAPRATLAGPPRAIGPLALVAKRVSVPGAAVVGDAAGFYDPFTGEGVTLALRGAEILAGVADRMLRGQAGSLDEYDRLRDEATRDKFRLNRRLQTQSHGRPSPTRSPVVSPAARTWPTGWWGSPATSCPRAPRSARGSSTSSSGPERFPGASPYREVAPKPKGRHGAVMKVASVPVVVPPMLLATAR